MIVKYLDGDVWGYIDNVRQAASRGIDCLDLIIKYNNSPEYQDECTPGNGEKDIASYLNGEKLADDIAASNKVFTMTTNDLDSLFDDSSFGNCHSVNLIDGARALENYPAAGIVLYLNDHKEYDTLILVTNQKCFLMNDKGQTIERLV